MPIDPEDANDPPFKQICSYYGLAMYMVQVLEHGLVNALLWLDLHPRTKGKWTPEEFDAFYTARFKETLRGLAERISKHAAISEELRDRLTECNKRRRLLAHHFFIESSDAIHLNEVEPLIDRLIDDRDYFRDSDRMLDAEMEPILQAMGFTQEYRMKQQAAYDLLLRMEREAIKPHSGGHGTR